MWETVVAFARRDGNRVAMGDMKAIRAVVPEYIGALRNLVHGYGDSDKGSAGRLWSVMQERVPPSLADVTLTIYLALLADPYRFLQTGRRLD